MSIKVPSERNTENIVRNYLNEAGYKNNTNIIIEEQISENPKINKLLQRASKKGTGRGFPEFIISFKDNSDNLIVIECKAKLSNHESLKRDKYADFAVDGALMYAAYLKDDFNVVAIAVSGQTVREAKISHFLWLKGNHTYKDISDKTLLNPSSLFNIIEKESKPLREEELIQKAIEYNEQLHEYSIPETERCTLISSILVALQDKSFIDCYKSFHQENYEGYNPNKELVESLIDACRRVLKKNHISSEKQEIIIREYEKIKQSNKFNSSEIITKERKKERNTLLRDLIHDLHENIFPYIKSEVFDVLGQFYTQFIRYAGSDSKTGLVLTPPHITDLFCELANLEENDIVFDPCCGTGGFLVSAMNFMLKKSGNNSERQSEIKSKQLIGIEQRADMFSHVCSNMMMRGDGKSNIFHGDCFDEKLKQEVKKRKPNKAFLNPPYDVGEDGQLEFIENAMDCLQKDGICIAICQMSTAISGKQKTIEIKKRLMKNHTLEAVLSMPDDLFYPIGVVTTIFVFKAHTPHSGRQKTFLGYFKDDGFLKVKNKGRIDQKENWREIKHKWLDSYVNKESVPGLSVTHLLNPEDEWCAEAYIETDYLRLKDKDFIEAIKNHVGNNFINNISKNSMSISSLPISKMKKQITLKKWKRFSIADLFNVQKGERLTKISRISGDIPLITATRQRNGVAEFIDKESFLESKQLFKDAITIDMFFQSFYQHGEYFADDNVHSLTLKKGKLSPFIALFLITILRFNEYKYAYGRQVRLKRLNSELIYLPEDEKGNPDWQFMEDYIKSLPYSSNLANSSSN